MAHTWQVYSCIAQITPGTPGSGVYYTIYYSIYYYIVLYTNPLLWVLLTADYAFQSIFSSSTSSSQARCHSKSWVVIDLMRWHQHSCGHCRKPTRRCLFTGVYCASWTATHSCQLCLISLNTNNTQDSRESKIFSIEVTTGRPSSSPSSPSFSRSLVWTARGHLFDSSCGQNVRSQNGYCQTGKEVSTRANC